MDESINCCISIGCQLSHSGECWPLTDEGLLHHWWIGREISWIRLRLPRPRAWSQIPANHSYPYFSVAWLRIFASCNCIFPYFNDECLVVVLSRAKEQKMVEVGKIIDANKLHSNNSLTILTSAPLEEVGCFVCKCTTPVVLNVFHGCLWSSWCSPALRSTMKAYSAP